MAPSAVKSRWPPCGDAATCRSCCRFCRSAVMYVASDGVGWPFEHGFSATRFSRKPLKTILLYCASGLVRGHDVIHVVLRLKLHMPDLTLSLVTNVLSHSTEQPTKARQSLQVPEEQDHCLLTRRGREPTRPPQGRTRPRARVPTIKRRPAA